MKEERDQRLTISLTKEQKETIMDKAWREKTTVSKYVHKFLEQQTDLFKKKRGRKSVRS